MTLQLNQRVPAIGRCGQGVQQLSLSNAHDVQNSDNSISFYTANRLHSLAAIIRKFFSHIQIWV